MDESFVLKCIRGLQENSEGIAFDIGANQGMYTTLLARKFKKVYAFEPHPFNRVFLKRNCALSNVEIVDKALSNENGKVKLYINHYNPGGHTINPKVAGTGLWGHDLETFVEVEAVTIDTFVKKNKITDPIVALKCDVEGAEDFLFLGAEKTLKENNIAIILEIHQMVDLIMLYNFFRRLGYNALNENNQVTNNFRHDEHYLLTKTLGARPQAPFTPLARTGELIE